MTDEITTTTLERDDQLPLRFTGHLLADQSSRTTAGPSHQRWTELRIYRTKLGKYVIEVVGLTVHDGERTRRRAEYFSTPQGLIEWLRTDNGGELGWVSRSALTEAARSDQGIASICAEEVE